MTRTISTKTYEFCTDKHFFGSIKPQRDSWAAANTIFQAMDGDVLTPQECVMWKEITGLDYQPGKVRRNLLLLCGRRSGKDLNAARLALRDAFANDHQPYVAPGEKAFILVISLNQRSNRVFLDYVRGFIKGSRFLRNEVVRETEHEIHLKNSVVIAGYPCTNASARGLTIKTFIMDEAAFFRQSGVTTDLEVFRSVRPAMASIPTSRFLILSSPYVKQGLVWDLYQQYFGIDSDFITIIKAPSALMNPTIDAKFLQQEEEADPEAFRREFLAEFIDSISALFTPEAIRNCIVKDIGEIPARPGAQHYAFFDGASGGTGGDSSALGIAARAGDGSTELLLCREWIPPFSPSTIVQECAQILRSYGLSIVTSDRYSPGWCQEAFTKAGIGFQFSDKSKSDIYREAIGPINSGKVRLLDNKKLVSQLASLERRVARGSGLETIDHPSGVHQHDDLANVACGALVLCAVPVQHLEARFVQVHGARRDDMMRLSPFTKTMRW